MTTTIAIPANESGMVRIFALSLDDDAAKALKANEGLPSPQARALGTEAVNSAHVEVFPVSDLGDMGLVNYLLEGPGIHPDTLEGDMRKLAALDGWVMIVYSSALRGGEEVLTVSRDLTLIGTYRLEAVDLIAPLDLSTPSALPTHSLDADPPARKRPSDAAMSGRVATLALLVAFGVVALMFWVGS